ncbi:pseudouridine synthase [Methylobrevis pamukkalensis]|uniref:Pseudouridine synthase n=1 Tax=Methylobrevis pamukkalensis TaxID=1439726 RepID=A0A1E3H5M4_9HYPH|nr:pseudouridine synthase [Methylobrevis pamukkalensis]ODN71610.1 Ribosomal large subunit pseudouridine synthase B [Methylobrevis pamukkalensis]
MTDAKDTSPEPAASGDPKPPERIAKVMARAGLCSRRDAEAWIAAGRVTVNGRVLETPAVTVSAADTILVDGEPLAGPERTRLWLYHKPKGLVTTARDPQGRTTVFERLPGDLPRVVTVGRLDINTEGLLLLTNDGGLARTLELPSTGWLRRYRVRCFGTVEQAALDALADGIVVDGVIYGAIEATIDSKKGDNIWLSIGLREGKNREVKNILGHLGLSVNRLIRVSFGPFQLNDLADGAVMEVPRKVLKDQLGERLAATSGADFTLPEPPPKRRAGPLSVAGKGRRPAAPDARAASSAANPTSTAPSARPAALPRPPGRRRTARHDRTARQVRQGTMAAHGSTTGPARARTLRRGIRPPRPGPTRPVRTGATPPGRRPRPGRIAPIGSPRGMPGWQRPRRCGPRCPPVAAARRPAKSPPSSGRPCR